MVKRRSSKRGARHQLSNIWSWERECTRSLPWKLITIKFRSHIVTQVWNTGFILQPGCHVWITSGPPSKCLNAFTTPVWKRQKGPSLNLPVLSSFPCVSVTIEVPHPMMRSQDTMGWCFLELDAAGHIWFGCMYLRWDWEHQWFKSSQIHF